MIKGLFDTKRWNALFQAFPDYYIPGFLMTLKISLVGLAVSLALGVVFGLLSTAKFKPFRIISRIYVELIQNTPLALQVVCYYSILPMLFQTPVSASLNSYWVSWGLVFIMEPISRRLLEPVLKLSRRDSLRQHLLRVFLIWRPCITSFCLRP